VSRSILLVPSTARGNGSGHLVRCLSLARSLGEGASVYIPEAAGAADWSLAELSLAYARELAGVQLVSRLPPSPGFGTWDLVVLDRRASSQEDLAFWERFACVLAIDEGGEAREAADYLLDILPRHPRSRGGRPNRSGLGLLDLPLNRRLPPREFKKVLISFGGEDPAGLALSLARLLVGEGLVETSALTIVSGALGRGSAALGLEGATLLGPVQDLKEHLARYDLVFTQFGLTAFEAAWAGCGVILLNPSRYHLELARASGFPEVGLAKPDLARLRSYLRSPALVLSALARVLPEANEALSGLLADLEPTGSRACPSCGSSSRRGLYRDPARSYFRCRDCGLVYMLRFSRGREKPYKKEYFFEEYRKQYGKTYLEDWPALSAMAKARLDIIEGMAKSSLGRRRGLSLLDVGCAYGPFLAAAKSRGQEPYGLDAAEEAASYVRRELGIPAAAGDFLDPLTASAFGGPFDVLTMWYVVEHFERLDRALRNAAFLVRPGGILALSTPSSEGATGRFDLRGFFAHSPEDHFTVWEPSRVKGILKAYGFRVERIRITGHHAERLPGLRFLARPGGEGRLGPATLARKALARLGVMVSRAFGLGDTFEVYAVREGSPSFGLAESALGSARGAKAERGIVRGPKRD
jgi:SAM-dependent methyltransferase